MSEFYIFIPQSLLHLPSDQLYAYSILQPVCSYKFTDKISITLQDLCYYIYGSETVERRVLNNLKSSINELISGDIIIGRNVSSTRYIIDKSSFVNDGEHFVTLTLSDIKKFTSTKTFRYYCLLLSTCNNKTKVGFHSIDSLASLAGIGVSTVYRYNEELEQNKIIYVRRSKNAFSKNESNIYGRYSDKHLVDKYADEKNYGRKNMANQLRSISARYNAFVAGATLTPDEEVQLYEDCLLYNSIMDEKQTHQPGNDYIMKKKELTIFGY